MGRRLPRKTTSTLTGRDLVAMGDSLKDGKGDQERGGPSPKDRKNLHLEEDLAPSKSSNHATPENPALTESANYGSARKAGSRTHRVEKKRKCPGRRTCLVGGGDGSTT